MPSIDSQMVIVIDNHTGQMVTKRIFDNLENAYRYYLMTEKDHYACGIEKDYRVEMWSKVTDIAGYVP